jgi:hypothetical protein
MVELRIEVWVNKPTIRDFYLNSPYIRHDFTYDISNILPCDLLKVKVEKKFFVFPWIDVNFN